VILNLSAVPRVVKPRFIVSRCCLYRGVICRFSNLKYGGGKGRRESTKATLKDILRKGEHLIL